jgi:hypothetical protein
MNHNKTGITFFGVIALFTAAPAAHAQLTLEVRLVDLSTSIVNKTASNYQVDGYAIQSPAGVLDPATWNSLADQGFPGWTEVLPSTANLAEFNISSFTTWSPGTRIGVGFPFGTSLSEFASKPMDATFEFITTTGQLENGFVEYIAVPEPGTLLIAAISGVVGVAARREHRTSRGRRM